MCPISCAMTASISSGSSGRTARSSETQSVLAVEKPNRGTVVVTTSAWEGGRAVAEELEVEAGTAG